MLNVQLTALTKYQNNKKFLDSSDITKYSAPCFRGNAYKGEPDIRDIMPRFKKIQAFPMIKSFNIKVPAIRAVSI